VLVAKLDLGHSQEEHEARHGPAHWSTSRTRWDIKAGDGTDETILELEGRKFSSNNDGAPLLCNFVCTSMERHVHINYCRGDPCDSSETQHIHQRMVPDPAHAKDWITHRAIVFTGAEWVSPCYDHSNQSSSFEYQVSKVMGLMTLYYLFHQTISADPYPREDQVIFAKWYVIY